MLPFTQVPVHFTKGLDQKSESKVSIPGSLAELENGVFTKTGAIQKRNGYVALSNEIENGAGYVTIGKSLAIYNDELLLFTGRKVYSYAGSTEKWADRGNISSVVVTDLQVTRNHAFQTNPDATYNAGIYVSAWDDSRGGIRYSVMDAETGSFFVADAVIHATGRLPKVISFGTDVVIFFVTGGGNLRYRIVSTLTPTKLGNVVNPISTMNISNPTYDACVVGSRLYVAYNNISVNTTLFYLDSSYVKGATTATALGNCNGGVSVWTDAQSRLWVGAITSDVSNGYVKIGLAPNSLSTFTLLGTHTEPRAPQRVCGYVPSESSTATVFFEMPPDTDDNSKQYVRSVTATATGVIGTAADLLRSVGLASKPFTHGEDTYLNVVHESTLQSTLFTIDTSGQIVARIHPNNAGGLRAAPSLSEVTSVGGGAYVLASTVTSILESNNHQFISPTGVTLVTLDFESDNAFQSAKLGQNLLVAGGVVQSYDSVGFVEQGFHLFPEDVTGTQTSGFAIVRTQTGSSGQPEITTITLPDASQIVGGQFFRINSAGDTTHYDIYFVIDGYGTAPDAGGTDIAIDINNYDSAETIGLAIAAAIHNDASAVVDFSAVSATDTVTFTTLTNAVTTIAANASAPNGVGTGAISAATRQYRVVAEWPDNYGQIHRSAPSVAISVTTSGANRAVSIGIPTLHLTQKKAPRAPVRFAVYRTEDIATSTGLFYRVSSFTASVENTDAADVVYFVDTATDASITANELLYTTGGVLDHIAPGACSLITTYRNRIYLGGFSDKLSIASSKLVSPGAPAAFSDALITPVDAKGGPVTALGVLDDKLIIFKSHALFAYSSDGPSDTGVQSDFSSPELIAGDVGCDNPSSVVQTPMGLMFQSATGIYLLDRSLALTYIGAPAEDYNDLTVTGALLVPDTKQVRFTTSETIAGRALMYDYFYEQWGTFTGHRAIDCDVWQGRFIWLSSGGRIYKETPGTWSDDGAAIKLRLTVNWMSFADILGYQRIRYVGILGDYKSPHTLQVSIATDDSPAFTQIVQIPTENIVAGNEYGTDPLYGDSDYYGGVFKPYRWRIQVNHQKCSNMKVAIEDIQTVNIGEGFRINGLNLTVGIKKGMFKLPAAQQY